MGTFGNKLIKVDIDKLVELLNKALADEWLAYYQYWIGAKVIVGAFKDAAIPELVEHAADELRHAEMLVDRILQLGGTPILEPNEWYDMTNCGYAAPKDPAVLKILEQSIAGEQCAIDVYNKILEFTKDKDEITYQMAFEILKDEVEHEDDLQQIQDDIKSKK
jgi:bacterioferritin